MQIQSFTAWLTEAAAQKSFDWRAGLPAPRANGTRAEAQRVCTIRMTTICGRQAWLSTVFGDAAFDFVRRRFRLFLGENPMLTESLWQRMWEVDRVEEINIRNFGLLDTLCWDLKSRVANLPVYQMLGGHSTQIEAYASTVTFPTLDAYEHHIKLCRDLGFRAFKLHAWGDVARDIELARALRQWVGPDATLMFDGSAGWDLIDALQVGRALQGEGYFWYEEPMREFHLNSYTKLCSGLDIPVLAAETSDGAHWNAASWIDAGALDMMRVSAVMKGGLTGAVKVAHLAESNGMRAQVHGGGTVNAQLCAAISNNDYYEQLVIDEDQIMGLSTQEDVPVVDGFIRLDDTPGLHPAGDVEALDAAALSKIELRNEET